MSEKHTPGPWALGPYEGHVQANGRMICSTMGHYDGKETTRATNVANAMLIAAAPDLLEALKEIYDYFEDTGFCACAPDECNCIVSLARKAIAKAVPPLPLALKETR